MPKFRNIPDDQKKELETEKTELFEQAEDDDDYDYDYEDYIHYLHEREREMEEICEWDYTPT